MASAPNRNIKVLLITCIIYPMPRIIPGFIIRTSYPLASQTRTLVIVADLPLGLLPSLIACPGPLVPPLPNPCCRNKCPFFLLPRVDLRLDSANTMMARMATFPFVGTSSILLSSLGLVPVRQKDWAAWLSGLVRCLSTLHCLVDSY